MRPLIAKIKPASGYSQLLRIGLAVLLTLTIFVLVSMNFATVAIALVVLSKWRMLAVRPRFWLANLRANSVDIIVSLSLVFFLIQASEAQTQLVWALTYLLWLAVIKPASSVFMVSVQGLAGMALGLTSLFLVWGDKPLYLLVLGTGLICVLTARHFLDNFDEPYAKLLSYIWGFFCASLTWILGHWLLYYANGTIAQPAVFIVSVGYGLAALYYLDHHDRLSKLIKLQIMIVSGVIVVAIFASLIINITATVNDLLK